MHEGVGRRVPGGARCLSLPFRRKAKADCRDPVPVRELTSHRRRDCVGAILSAAGLQRESRCRVRVWPGLQSVVESRAWRDARLHHRLERKPLERGVGDRLVVARCESGGEGIHEGEVRRCRRVACEHPSREHAERRPRRVDAVHRRLRREVARHDGRVNREFVDEGHQGLVVVCLIGHCHGEREVRRRRCARLGVPRPVLFALAFLAIGRRCVGLGGVHDNGRGRRLRIVGVHAVVRLLIRQGYRWLCVRVERPRGIVFAAEYGVARACPGASFDEHRYCETQKCSGMRRRERQSHGQGARVLLGAGAGGATGAANKAHEESRWRGVDCARRSCRRDECDAGLMRRSVGWWPRLTRDPRRRDQGQLSAKHERRRGCVRLRSEGVSAIEGRGYSGVIGGHQPEERSRVIGLRELRGRPDEGISLHGGHPRSAHDGQRDQLPQEVAGGTRGSRDVGELCCDGWAGRMRCGGWHLCWGDACDVSNHPRVRHEQVDCCHERLEVYRGRGSPRAGSAGVMDGSGAWSMSVGTALSRARLRPAPPLLGPVVVWNAGAPAWSVGGVCPWVRLLQRGAGRLEAGDVGASRQSARLWRSDQKRSVRHYSSVARVPRCWRSSRY